MYGACFALKTYIHTICDGSSHCSLKMILEFSRWYWTNATRAQHFRRTVSLEIKLFSIGKKTSIKMCMRGAISTRKGWSATIFSKCVCRYYSWYVSRAMSVTTTICWSKISYFSRRGILKITREYFYVSSVSLYDDVPSRFAKAIADYWNSTFSQQWNGCEESVAWPARSHDFFNLGGQKTMVKETPNHSDTDLTSKISVVAANLKFLVF